MLTALILSLVGGGQTLYDFGPEDTSRWTTVHDTVMGGVSRGEVRRTDAGTLVFEGYLSLDNNGGFTSFRTRDRLLPFEGSDGIEMRVKGDGRTYILSFDREGVGLFGGGYWQRFESKKDEWTTIRLPWSDFEPVSFGRKMPSLPELTPETARGLTVYLYDKKAGDFEIEFDSFATYVDSAQIAASNAGLPENCKTLERLIELSGIGEELAQLDGYTLFAPNDEAFNQLPTAQSLMQPSQVEALKSVLRHHVVPVRVDSGAALFLTEATMADGASLPISLVESELRIGGARVLDVDYALANGIVHVIDAVLLPGELQNASTTAATTPAPASNKNEAPIVPGYNVLSQLIVAAELDGAIADLNAFTLFAPTDDAFGALPPEAVEALLQTENQEVLQTVLLRHVLIGKVTAFQAIGVEAQPLAGETLPIDLVQNQDGQRTLTVAGINISKPDQLVGNAVVHQIDSVILPDNLGDLLRPKLPPVRRFLEEVIAQGVPQYNRGDIAGCAQRYRQALEALLLLEQLPGGQSDLVRRTLATAARQGARDSAWTLRSAIDRIRLDFDQEV
ncbi:MAG: CIA30 family protein [Planctomycetes bacterium]|nr:CIA30 family protein [Planctomycetota bacterium]